jgi:hypothetical protein
MKTQTNIFGPIELPSKASPCNISNKSGIFILLVLVSFPSEYCPILHKRWNVTSAHWAKSRGHMDIFILIDNLLCISKMDHYMVCIITPYKVFLVE